MKTRYLSIKNDLETLSNFIRRLKNYLPIIIFVPTILGGIWQIAILSKFGLSYIRFFSISQLVSDGLIMLVFIPIITVITYLIYRAASINNPIIEKRLLLKTILLSLIVLFILGYLIDSIFINPKQESIGSFVLFLIASLAFYLTTILGKFGEIYISRYHKRRAEFIENSKKRMNWKFILNYTFSFLKPFIIMLIIILVFMTYILIAIDTILSISNYYMPNNLYNIENVKKSIVNDYKIDKDDFKISYFNDTYIFVEHYKVEKKKRDSLQEINVSIPTEIIILKSDKFFD